MQLRTSEVAEAVGGTLEGPDVVVDGGSIDSRTVQPGQLFVPVLGARDGHDFIASALAAGAAAYLTTGPTPGGTAVVVDDTVVALQAAGRLARSRLAEPVIGITGSVGKTSVKDLLVAALGTWFRAAASERSFNNELGVPLTLLGAPDGTEAVVVEMGARGVGHIAQLCAIAAPSIGVVTRVAAVHTEAFGHIDEVTRAKGELVEALPSLGTAVLNAADERVAAMAARTDAAVLTFGEGGDVRAMDLQLDHELTPRFRLASPWGEVDVDLAVRGLHQAENAVAAAAAALAAGVDLAAVAAGLATATLSPWRMELRTAPSGALILNDAYNANPTSMAAALDSLAHLSAGRRVAVLGLMAELGATEAADHEAVARLADRLGIEVVAVGTRLYGPSVAVADDVETAIEALGPIGPGDAVLVKGSRVVGLERLAERLVDDA